MFRKIWMVYFDPTITSNRIHFPQCQTRLMSMEHGLHPNMNSGITCLQRHIHSLLILQTVEDTHSKVVIASVKYLVKWVSILNSQNSDELYLFVFFLFVFKNLLKTDSLIQSPSSTDLSIILFLD